MEQIIRIRINVSATSVPGYCLSQWTSLGCTTRVCGTIRIVDVNRVLRSIKVITVIRIIRVIQCYQADQGYQGYQGY